MHGFRRLWFCTLSVVALVLCLAYGIVVWSVIALPWTWGTGASLVFDCVRLMALVLAPVLVWGAIVHFRQRCRAVGALLSSLAVAVLAVGCFQSVWAFVMIAALSGSESTYAVGSAEAMRQFRQSVVPVLGNVEARHVEATAYEDPMGYGCTVHFKTDDIEWLKLSLDVNGWTFHEPWWRREKLLNNVGGECLLHYRRDEDDGSWAVEFQENW